MKDILTYGKIKLRPLEPADIDLLYHWENDSGIWEVSDTKTPFSKHILAQYILESAKGIYETQQLRLIIENHENEAVGALDLFDFEPYHLRAGVGVLVHKETDQNHGYATDALKALSNYAQQVLGLKQLYANISGNNEKSIKLFEKAGFQKVGLKKKWAKTSSGWKDEWLLQKIF